MPTEHEGTKKPASPNDELSAWLASAIIAGAVAFSSAIWLAASGSVPWLGAIAGFAVYLLSRLSFNVDALNRAVALLLDEDVRGSFRRSQAIVGNLVNRGTAPLREPPLTDKEYDELGELSAFLYNRSAGLRLGGADATTLGASVRYHDALNRLRRRVRSLEGRDQ